MRDPLLAKLLTTLDAVPAANGAITADAHDDFAAAHQRLRAAQRILGAAVQESPYQAFARRLLVPTGRPEPIVAVA